MGTKSIPLKTWEVQAILDDRKSTLRRVVKMNRPRIYKAACAAGRWSETFGGEIQDEVAEWYAREVAKSPYKPGDVLWVREKWRMQNYGFDYDTRTYQGQELQYRADLTDGEDECYGRRGGCAPCRWSPSIHMPKSAARLFLRVKSVRVERLREITPEQCAKEGLTETQKQVLNEDEYWYWFMNLWNSTIKPADLPRYGWDANPFVWVVEFERCERPENFLKEDADHER